MKLSSVAELYASLAENARASAASNARAIETASVMPAIENAESIIANTIELAGPGLKTLSDFGGDHSRWEFSVLGRLYSVMNRLAVEQMIAEGVVYSGEEAAWLLFETARRVLPARQKHRQLRNRRPYLLDRAAGLIVDRQAQRAVAPES